MTTEHDTTAEARAEDAIVARPAIDRGALVGTSLDGRIRYARLMSDASLVPAAYRGKPANAFLAVETGTMLGVHPIAAINGINVIEGKPTLSPALMTALVRRAGHKVRISTSGTVRAGDLCAVVEVIRADDPDFTYRATWDLERAERAGLCRLEVDGGRTKVIARSDKGRPLPWESYTEAMLKARAIGEVCREAAEDALCGVHYTPEELGADVDVDGEVVTGEIVHEQTPQQAVQQQAAEPDPEALRGVALDPELAAMVRDAIVSARTTEQLGAAWAAAAPFQRSRLEATLVADEQGVEVDALALFERAVAAVKAGTAPLEAPGDSGPDEGPQAPQDGPQAPRAAGFERGPIDPDYDPWATGPQGVKLDDPAPGDATYTPPVDGPLEVVDAEVVDEPVTGVPAAEAILGGVVIDRVDATPGEAAAADRHRAVAEDRDERVREHNPEPGAPVPGVPTPGRAAMAAARESLRANAARATATRKP